MISIGLILYYTTSRYISSVNTHNDNKWWYWSAKISRIILANNPYLWINAGSVYAHATTNQTCLVLLALAPPNRRSMSPLLWLVGHSHLYPRHPSHWRERSSTSSRVGSSLDGACWDGELLGWNVATGDQLWHVGHVDRLKTLLGSESSACDLAAAAVETSSWVETCVLRGTCGDSGKLRWAWATSRKCECGVGFDGLVTKNLVYV